MRNWYALHVKHCCESLAHYRLERNGIETFYPVYRKFIERRGEELLTARALFPGYLFARFDTDRRSEILSTPKVVSILGDHRGPVSVTDFEIENLRTLVNSPALLKPVDPLATGNRVRVTSGPLTGVEGFVTYSEQGLPHVVVNVRMFNRAVSAEVDRDCLAALEPEKKAA